MLNTNYTDDKKIFKIVITGGPCAGKTTAMSWIINTFTKQGYTVLIIPETATDLINSGVAPWTCESALEYQRVQVELQKTKENAYEYAAHHIKGDKVLIICDRGILDNKAYMKPNEFSTIMKEIGSNEVAERDSYDAVFHLVTAADGAEEAYTLSNNGARTESIEQARDVDKRLMNAWTGHPHYRIIDNSTDFPKKMNRLMGEITAVLGEPLPYEVERKFLIKYPNIEYLESLPNCQKIDIVQTYLSSVSGKERRIRARGQNGHYIYYLTEKEPVSAGKRIEIERRLTQEEYIKYSMEADPSLHTIRKTRYCLSYNSTYFEIDIYPSWNNQAFVEVELQDINQVINFPDFIEVIREVTGEDTYSNYNIAKDMPDEETSKVKKLK
jgi:CYTH domain-containing protein/predicted ATPase